MKITVTRTGGFAGLTATWTVLVDDQPDPESWRELVQSLPWQDRPRLAPQPDRYVYRIQCSHRRATLPEQALEGPWRELVDRVRERATG